MEGFEVELEHLTTSNLHSTYCFSAFGCGAGFNTAFGLAVVHDGNNSGTNPFSGRASVSNGGLTHFGVHLNTSPAGRINYNWLDRGNDGSLYIAGTTTLAAGQPAPPAPTPPEEPASPPAILTPDWSIDANTGQLVATITNDTNHPLWVQGVSAEDNANLTLDQLLATDPLFTTLVMAEAQLLDPGDTLSEIEDILASSIGGRAMFWVYGFAGDEFLSDAENDIWNADCGAGCEFDLTGGELQSRMMTAVNLGVAPVPVPAALPLMLGALGALGTLRRRAV